MSDTRELQGNAMEGWSDTPRVDALMDSIAVTEGGFTSIPLEKAGEIQLFAEQLERELASANAEVASLTESRNDWRETCVYRGNLLAERDAEVARLKRHAEAMADAIQFGDMAILTVAKAAADSYRSDYPKDPK